MFPVARSSRICLSCIKRTPTLRPYASAVTAKNTTTKARKSKATKSENDNDDAPKPTSQKPYKSRIESFLEDLDASSIPTLEDLHGMKPGKRPQGANYAQGYDEALKRVMRAFRGPQLIQLANQLGFDDKLPQTQREIAQILLEKSWDWEPPYLAGHKEKDELQVVPKDIPIPPSLVLLLLLEDPHIISELGRRFGLIINLEIVDGTVLQVRGHPDGISNLESYLGLRSREVLIDTVDVRESETPSISILQWAGRLSQAFIETSPNGNELRFMAFDEEALHKAKRMMQRYTERSTLDAHTPLLWHVQSQRTDAGTTPSQYASFPFLSPKAPAWQLSNQRLFRIRRVMEWLEDRDVSRNVSLSDGLLLDHEGSIVELRQRLPLLGASPKPGFIRSYIASVGHVLFPVGSPNSTTLEPGKWPLETGISLIKEKTLRPNFLPSLPSPLLSSPPSSIITVHRAVYRRNLEAASQSNELETKLSATSDVFLLEVAMEHTVAPPELDDLDEQEVPAETISIRPLDGPTICQAGTEESVNVALPERPMDVRLTVRDMRPVSEQEMPDVIKTYLQDLLHFLNFTTDKQPSTPHSIEYNGNHYVLDTSSSVRRTEEYFSHSKPQWEEEGGGIEAISETSLDLESKEKMSECLIRSYDCETEEDFNTFLSKCATISSMPFTSLAQQAEQMVPYFSE